MKPFLVSPLAADDLNEIWLYLTEEASEEFADRTLEKLVHTFSELAETPGIGHRRPDLKQSAAREGVSLNQFINLAVAEKVEYLENEAWIARRRQPSQDRIDKAIALLNRKGTLPPAPGDEIPETYKTWEREQARKGRRKAS